MDLDFPEEATIQKNNKIIDEVLKKRVQIVITQFTLKEDFKNDCSIVTCSYKLKPSRRKAKKITGTGSGVIDALFNAAMAELTKNFHSLKEIELYDFLVKVKFQESIQQRRTDAPVEIKIALVSSNKRRMYFKSTSNSLAKAGIKSVCKAIEYLMNAELAAIQLCKDIENANKRNRVDLTSRYTFQLAELVKCVSYAEAIKNISKKE
ncbi:hypothetical protein CMI37_03755 [Candidatus Pacearchaeota archaeon]|nr:hypothetical protein [Candidatus Pacearchaeota archaeon]